MQSMCRRPRKQSTEGIKKGWKPASKKDRQQTGQRHMTLGMVCSGGMILHPFDSIVQYRSFFPNALPVGCTPHPSFPSLPLPSCCHPIFDWRQTLSHLFSCSLLIWTCFQMVSTCCSASPQLFGLEHHHYCTAVKLWTCRIIFR